MIIKLKNHVVIYAGLTSVNCTVEASDFSIKKLRITPAHIGHELRRRESTNGIILMTKKTPSKLMRE